MMAILYGNVNAVIQNVFSNKIDGVIAMIEALGVYLSEPIYNNDFIPLRT